MQNGIGNVETLAGVVGEARTVGAMAIFGAVIPEPGSVKVTVIASETLVGEIDGRLTSRAMDLARMLDGAGIPTKPSDNIMREIWHKALYNIALNPLSAIFQVTYGQIADNPGVDLGMDSPDEYLEILWNRKLPPTRDHRSSMLQDIVRGKRTEIDYINGKVVELGREYGIPTPYNNAVVKIVRAKEVIGPA
jgi:2-dehydropantoate 2-reductase